MPCQHNRNNTPELINSAALKADTSQKSGVALIEKLKGTWKLKNHQGKVKDSMTTRVGKWGNVLELGFTIRALQCFRKANDMAIGTAVSTNF